MSAIHLSSKVLIVGAGPVGLTLAHELLRQGVQVRLIDKEHTASQNARALGVWARTLELFAETGTGIVEEMLERGVKTPAFNIWSEGARLACLDFAHQITGPYPFILMIPQPETEVILTRHVLSLGGTIERGTELVSLTQQEEGVTAVLRTADGAEEETRVDWLIGCDGARSTVRRLLDIPFVGKTLEQSFVTGNVRVQWDLPPEEAQAFLHRGNLVAFFPLPEAFHYRIVIAHQPGVMPEREEVTLEEIQQGIAAYGPAGARASEPDGLARFLVNQRKVERYMTGRVLLAGDAAHIHTFIGAQGMNTGIQDAFNLAWKLALVVNGRARAQLLESYEQEREHVSKDLLMTTGLASRFALLQQPLLRGLRDALAPRITPLTRTQRFLVNALAELSISYRHSPIVSDAQGPRIWRRSRLQAGDRAPDGSVWEGSSPIEHRLFELLSGTRHTLLIFSPHPLSKAKALARFLPAFEDLIVSYQIIQDTDRRSEQEEIGKQFYDPDGLLAHRYGCANGGLVLIRPDGYIGFVSRQIERERLQRYLQDLFFIAS